MLLRGLSFVGGVYVRGMPNAVPPLLISPKRKKRTGGGRAATELRSSRIGDDVAMGGVSVGGSWWQGRGFTQDVLETVVHAA